MSLELGNITKCTFLLDMKPINNIGQSKLGPVITPRHFGQDLYTRAVLRL